VLSPRYPGTTFETSTPAVAEAVYVATEWLF